MPTPTGYRSPTSNQRKRRRVRPKPPAPPKPDVTLGTRGQTGHQAPKPPRVRVRATAGVGKRKATAKAKVQVKRSKATIQAHRAADKERERILQMRLLATRGALAGARAGARDNAISKAGFATGGPDLSGFVKRGGGLALDILEETTRPVHGLAGASLEAVKGGGFKAQQKAFVRGVENKDKYLFSDVLKEAGAPGIVQKVGGFGLDVLADPTTYVSFGTTSIAKKAALSEGHRVFTKAKAAGMSDQGAKTVANRAARNKTAELEKAGKANKGLTVGIGKVRTSGKTTAKISRAAGVPKAARRVRRSRPVQVAGQNMRPGFRPEGAAPKAFEKVRAAERQHRATKTVGEKRAQQRALAYSKALNRKDHGKVIDALESGSLKNLSEQLRPVARQMRDDYRHMLRLERQRGIAGGRVKDYFPHVPGHTLEPGAKPPRAASAANLASAKSRKVKKTIRQLRDEDPSLFSEDVPLVFGSRAASSARGVAKADYLKAVAQSGRRLTPETKIDTATEAAYKVTPKAIQKVEWADALKAVEGGERGYVVLNKSVAERALKGTAKKEGPAAELGRWFDRRMQGPVKTILTVPNPQYHFTNLYGDLFNAYLADTSLRSLAQSSGALRRLAKREAARKTLGKQIDPTSKGVKIGGRKVTYDELIAEAEEQGAIRTGFIGQDLPEVLDAQAKEFAERMGKGRVGRRLGPKGQKALRSRAGHAVTHPIDTIRDVSQYREDFVRLGTYIQARKSGLAPAKAAERVAKFHFDYGDLTEFERNVLRRVFPFYTFTARNAPLQAGRLLARPGKYANLQKTREEFAKAAGLPDGWEEKLEDYEQRGIPMPLPLKDSMGNTLLLFPKLPAMDLGRITLNPEEQAQYIAAMTTPLIKSPFELLFDYNLFFREPITNKDAPLVAAPDGVGSLPKAVRDKLGITKFLDKRTGQKIWGWPAKLDYVSRLTPMSATALQLGTQAKNRQGQSKELKTFGYLTGLRVSPLDKTKADLNRAFDRRGELEERMAALRQQDRSKRADGTYRSEYRRLLDEAKNLSTRVYRLKKKAGYKILPETGAPSSSGGSLLDSGGGGTSILDAGSSSKSILD